MDTPLSTVTHLLEVEEGRLPVQGLDDLNERAARRATITEHLALMEASLQELRSRLRRLPTLPPLTAIQWAQAVQALPNLIFLELDTTGLREDAEIIRVVLLDAEGHLLLDSSVHPTQPISAAITSITGVTNQQVEQAPTLGEMWQRLSKELRGKYVVSYNLDFDRAKLREAAERLHLEELTFVGSDLMEQATRYFGVSSYPKLAVLCSRIGHPLPDHPHQTALDRAAGQRALLVAMAQAITHKDGGTASTVPHSDDALDLDPELASDLDEHPF